MSDTLKILGTVAAIIGLFLITILVIAQANDDGPYGLSSDWEYSKFLQEPKAPNQDWKLYRDHSRRWYPIGHNEIHNRNSGVVCKHNKARTRLRCY